PSPSRGVPFVAGLERHQLRILRAIQTEVGTMGGDQGRRSWAMRCRGGGAVQSVRPARRNRPGPRFILAAALSAGLLASLYGAGPALGADGLTVTTPYPAVSVAPGSKASFDLTVTTT